MKKDYVYKVQQKNNIKYYLFCTNIILFILAGCSQSNIEKLDIKYIKGKTKDIKKEDLEELKKK